MCVQEDVITFRRGNLFDTKKLLIEAISDYSIRRGVVFVAVKNNVKNINLVCARPGNRVGSGSGRVKITHTHEGHTHTRPEIFTGRVGLTRKIFGSGRVDPIGLAWNYSKLERIEFENQINNKFMLKKE